VPLDPPFGEAVESDDSGSRAVDLDAEIGHEWDSPAMLAGVPIHPARDRPALALLWKQLV